ncbi:hypothetical protein DCAR_0208963 [Daucus carota subsp. sativus]|uniref:Uncharacterized protein n=1 Tax=Daucus carota subsp. sativus TaxID=79200 RepID=A0A161XIV2_DAUCS|nr:hypothetical protein DCAR_0208963 [Daucus carota subsp. sativus]
MAFSETLASPVLLMILLFFFLTSAISCNTNNGPCPPTLPGTPILQETPPSLPGVPIFPETPTILPGTPTYFPGTPVLPKTPETPIPFLPVPPILPYPPTLPATPIPNLPVTPTLPYPPTLPATPIPKNTNKNTCPKNVLKLGVCTDMLGRSLGQTFGSPPTTPCCKILEGLIDFEAAICLCTALKANVLGIVFDFPIAINNVFNHCEKDNPSGFQCE